MWSILSVFLKLHILYFSLFLSLCLFIFLYLPLPPPYISPSLLLLFPSPLSLLFTFLFHSILLLSPLSQICYFKFFPFHFVSKSICEYFSIPHISLISQKYFYFYFSLIRCIYYDHSLFSLHFYVSLQSEQGSQRY